MYQNPMFVSDNELAISALNGNERSFNEIIKRYKTKVFNKVNSSMKNNHVSEEITQDVFVKLFLSFKGQNYRPNTNFAAWVNTIATNTAIDYLRKSKTYTVEYDHTLNSNFSDDLMLNFEKIDMESVLLKEAEKLSPRYRTLIKLRLQNMTYKEIHNVAGYSKDGAIRSMKIIVRLMNEKIGEHHA